MAPACRKSRRVKPSQNLAGRNASKRIISKTSRTGDARSRTLESSRFGSLTTSAETRAVILEYNVHYLSRLAHVKQKRFFEEVAMVRALMALTLVVSLVPAVGAQDDK